jgi:hypothetical protein
MDMDEGETWDWKDKESQDRLRAMGSGQVLLSAVDAASSN